MVGGDEKLAVRWGATPEEWVHFDLILDLTADLLPVVSDPTAEISPSSKIKSLGKTPSEFNREGKVRGLADWTARVTKPWHIDKWMAEDRYGICLQTRRVRALDIDVDHPQAQDIAATFALALGVSLPARGRANSFKVLLGFAMPGELAKRSFRTEYGLIEVLGNGQQALVAGVHPSGARYEWAGELPSEFPTVALDDFERAWAAIVESFAIEPEQRSRSGRIRGENLDIDDPRVERLEAEWITHGWGPRGQLYIECPWKGEHSTDSGETECAYLPAGTEGYEQGHYKCFHAGCASHSDADFDNKIGIGIATLFEDIRAQCEAEDLAKLPLPVELFGTIRPKLDRRFLIKGLLLAGTKIVIIGQPGCGKSFFAIDVSLHIAAGREWFDRKVTGGGVVYIAAEGQAGVRLRVDAWKRAYGYEKVEMPFAMVPTSVDLLKPGADTKGLAEVLAYLVKLWGRVDLVVIDTLSQTFGGGDENGADMAAYVANVAKLAAPHGCATAIVHHQPLDAPSKRPRGHGSLWGAADTLLHVEGQSGVRRITVVKQKDIDPGADIFFQLRPVVIGCDEELETVTSCIVEPANVADIPEKGRRLHGKNKVVFDAFQRVLAKNSVEPPAEISARVQENDAFCRVVLVSDWLDEALAALATPDTKSDSHRKAFNRAREALQSAQIVEIWGDFAWSSF